MKIFHQQTIRENNLRQVMGVIKNSDGISRVQISQKTKLSRTTISSLVEDLIQIGYVTDSGEAITNKQGRRPSNLHINRTSKAIAVISWQPSYIEGALIDLNGNIILINDLQSIEDYTNDTIKLFNKLVTGASKGLDILSLCIVFPGSIEATGRFLTTVLPVSSTEPFAQRFKQMLPNQNIAFFNDTACMAYAEKISFSTSNQTYAYVNMSKGIGAVLFNNGNLLRGANGMTTQLGHFSIDFDGVKCECGNRGCLEKVIGEKTIANLAKKCEIKEHLGITYANIGSRAATGDKDYLFLIDTMAKSLAHALSNMVTIYNVPQIIIGGKAMLLGQTFLDRLDFYVKNTGFNRFTSNLDLVFSKFPLDHKAELSGAAQYYFDMYHSFLEANHGRIILK